MNTCGGNSKPIVIVASFLRQVGVIPVAATETEHLNAVRLDGASPVVVPGVDPYKILPLLDVTDDIDLAEKPSNVPLPLQSKSSQKVHNPSLPLDPMREALTLPRIRKTIEGMVPFFAICRGFQEFNFDFVGRIHQAVNDLPGRMDHRPPNEDSIEARYGTTHSIDLVPGGLLEKWLGEPQVTVNTVLGQGIDRLAPGLRAEAFAPDGIIEAITVPDAPGFNLAVQWHPEWRAAENPVSRCLLEQFGMACADHRVGNHRR